MDGDDPHVNVDTTVQEKNITYSTDAKMYRKILFGLHPGFVQDLISRAAHHASMSNMAS